MRLLPINISWGTPAKKTVEQVKKELKNDSKARLSFSVTKYRTFKADMQQDELRKGIDLAEDPISPDRSVLLAIYKEAMKDPHVLSQIRTNILKVIGSPFAVFKEGTDEIDEDATKLLQKPWFNRFRYLFHETPYYGHSLVEFQQMLPPTRPNGLKLEFKKVKVFPREHVRQETGEIILDLSLKKGIPYREEPWNEWFLEIGESHDLGLLHILCRYVIWKNYSLTDASRYGEKFGMPIIVMKTKSRKKEELEEQESMASNFGNNLWMILDDEDEFEVQWPKNQQGHKMFIENAEFYDSQMSRLIAGQESTSTEKAFVGSAEVHERILNEYIEEAMRQETFFNNEELFPFLMKHGYPLEGLEFRYLKFMNDEEDAEKEGDDGDPPEPDKKATANFTKPLSIKVGKGLQGTLTQRIEALYFPSCCDQVPEAINSGTTPANAVDLDRAVNKAMKKVYDKKLKAGGIDEEVFWHWSAGIYREVLSGYGVNLSDLKYGTNDHVMITQLRHNAHVFAAFKNHHFTNELVNALVDENGKVRSESSFLKVAKGLGEKYDLNWYKTERVQALLSGRNAQRWQKIQSRKGTFPNVEYVTVKDDRTSQICKDLSGGVWSVDDPVLDRLAPSNHWRCRSFLRSTKKELNPKVTNEELADGFTNNPGKSGMVYGDDHPYYDVQDQHEGRVSNVFGAESMLPISGEQLQENIRLLNELNKKDYSSIQTYPDSGGWLAIHKLADKRDLTRNRKVGHILANKKGHAVEVTEHLEDGTPNPELRVNGILSDIKSPKNPSGLDSLLRKAAKKQGINNVVFEVLGSPSLEELTKGLRRGFHNRSGISWIDVVFKGEVVRISREMFENGVILKELERFIK